MVPLPYRYTMIEAHPPLPEKPSSVLVFGGSFDPPHVDHLRLAEKARESLGCAHILVVPARVSPHKEEDHAPAEHRFEMARLMCAGHDNVSISRLELDREGPSYTVDTITSLRGAWGPDTDIRLLIGSDQAVKFDTWHQHERIIEMCTPAILVRAPHTLEQLQGGMLDETWREWVLDFLPSPISSTMIRDRILRGQDVGGLVPNEVLRYIRENHLYENASAAAG